jgi:hypothetical protein
MLQESSYISEYKQHRKLFTLNLTKSQREAFEEIKSLYGASSISRGLVLLVQDALRAKYQDPHFQITDGELGYPQKNLLSSLHRKEKCNCSNNTST